MSARATRRARPARRRRDLAPAGELLALLVTLAAITTTSPFAASVIARSIARSRATIASTSPPPPSMPARISSTIAPDPPNAGYRRSRS